MKVNAFLEYRHTDSQMYKHIQSLQLQLDIFSQRSHKYKNLHIPSPEGIKLFIYLSFQIDK